MRAAVMATPDAAVPWRRKLLGRWLLWTRRIAVAVGTAGVLASPADAEPITYLMTGLASGQLGTRRFTDTPFLVALTADTATAAPIAPGVPCNNASSATFMIGDVGYGAIITRSSVADNAAYRLIALVRGRCDELGPMWMNGRNEIFATYGLTWNVGPIPLALPSAPPGVVLETTGGALTFTQVGALAFEARIERPRPVPVADRGALLLLSSLVAVCGGAAARPRRAG